ncbi:MAG: hypothetical protein QOE57_1030, partial [Acidimicrobiaceae bacterium]|nr:hypothetical protein [Acidimicrobiaceae bacterium]
MNLTQPDVTFGGDGAGSDPSPRRGRLRLGVGLLIGAGAIYAVVSSSGGFADAAGAATSARPGWLVAGGLAEAAS